jgi:hypothetical protein
VTNKKPKEVKALKDFGPIYCGRQDFNWTYQKTRKMV